MKRLERRSKMNDLERELKMRRSKKELKMRKMKKKYVKMRWLEAIHRSMKKPKTKKLKK